MGKAKIKKNKSKKNKYIFPLMLTTILIIVIFIFFINAKPDEPVIDKLPELEPKSINKIEEAKDISEVLPMLIPDFTKDVETLKANSLILLKDANDFYNDYKDFSTYVSKNGLLYNFYAKQYITPESIYTENELATERARILYLNKKDVNELIKGDTDDDFVICISYEIAEGYIFATFNEYIVISKEQYTALLQKYITSHTTVESISMLKQSEEGKKTIDLIIDAINKEENTKNHFDIRFLSKDDKYALTILSPVGKSAEIKQYILEQKDNNWYVVLKDIEKQLKPAKYINTSLVDFNLDFMPLYNIYEYKTLISDDYNPLYNALKEEKYIENDSVEFFCMVDDFAYFEFKSGKNFLCNLSTERSWTVYPVRNYEEAVLMMLSINEKAPLFVLKQYRQR